MTLTRRPQAKEERRQTRADKNLPKTQGKCPPAIQAKRQQKPQQ